LFDLHPPTHQSINPFLIPAAVLWRLLLQMTRMMPLRFTILQFSQSFLTDARTFMFKSFSFP